MNHGLERTNDAPSPPLSFARLCSLFVRVHHKSASSTSFHTPTSITSSPLTDVHGFEPPPPPFLFCMCCVNIATVFSRRRSLPRSNSSWAVARAPILFTVTASLSELAATKSSCVASALTAAFVAARHRRLPRTSVRRQHRVSLRVRRFGLPRRDFTALMRAVRRVRNGERATVRSVQVNAATTVITSHHALLGHCAAGNSVRVSTPTVRPPC